MTGPKIGTQTTQDENSPSYKSRHDTLTEDNSKEMQRDSVTKHMIYRFVLRFYLLSSMHLAKRFLTGMKADPITGSD